MCLIKDCLNTYHVSKSDCARIVRINFDSNAWMEKGFNNFFSFNFVTNIVYRLSRIKRTCSFNNGFDPCGS